MAYLYWRKYNAQEKNHDHACGIFRKKIVMILGVYLAWILLKFFISKN